MDHEHHGEQHRSHRGGWLRAGVLGANDGLVSTASIVMGVAAGDVERSVILLTGVAALVAGACSMAAGEYASVSSQRDAEEVDLAMEATALVEDPEAELRELAGIYRARGLSRELADQVARELHGTNALAAHARDELGLDPDGLARPAQAAVVSAGAFSVGALVPVLTMALVSASAREVVTALVTIAGLAGIGVVGARLGGAAPVRGAVRLVVLGAVAMGVTFLVGTLVGTSL